MGPERIATQLAALVRLSARLAPHPLELDEQPLDRLLLGLSPAYARTRALALEAGAEFVPQAITKERSVLNFEVESSRILYSPVASELAWVLGTQRDPDRAERLLLLARLVSVVYHDWSHFILNSFIRPARPPRSERELGLIFNFIEALAIFRDHELAWELGEISRPLRSAGLLYEACGNHPSPPGKDARELRRWVGTIFLHLMGGSWSSIQSAFERAGLGEPPLRPSAASRAFVRKTIPAWLLRYRSRRGLRISAPGAVLRGAWDLPILSVDGMLRKQEIWDEFFDRYNGLFREN
jgi:hypothetical protein